MYLFTKCSYYTFLDFCNNRFIVEVFRFSVVSTLIFIHFFDARLRTEVFPQRPSLKHFQLSFVRSSHDPCAMRVNKVIGLIRILHNVVLVFVDSNLDAS